MLLLDENRFVTCSSDSTIRIWSFDKSIPEKILSGHTSSVYNMILFQNNKLASASADNKIKIWNIETGELEKTLTGSKGWVYGLLQLPNNQLLSGGGEKILRFWDVDSSTCVKTMNISDGPCCSIIQLNNEQIACSSNRNIHTFDINGSDLPLKTLTGHNCTIRDLLFLLHSYKLVSTSEDKTTRIWDLDSNSCILSLQGNAVSYMILRFKENIIAIS